MKAKTLIINYKNHILIPITIAITISLTNHVIQIHQMYKLHTTYSDFVDINIKLNYIVNQLEKTAYPYKYPKPTQEELLQYLHMSTNSRYQQTSNQTKQPTKPDFTIQQTKDILTIKVNTLTNNILPILEKYNNENSVKEIILDLKGVQSNDLNTAINIASYFHTSTNPIIGHIEQDSLMKPIKANKDHKPKKESDIRRIHVLTDMNTEGTTKLIDWTRYPDLVRSETIYKSKKLKNNKVLVYPEYRMFSSNFFDE